MNSCNFIVRLTRTPELRFVSGSGTAVCKFGGAMDKYNAKKLKEQGKKSANFLNFIAWGKTAELIANTMDKGQQIGLECEVDTGSYTKDDGTKVYTTDFKVNKITFVGSRQEQSNDMSMGGMDTSDFRAVDDYDPLDSSIPF